MASINQFLKQLAKGDSIKDYKHASRLFVDDNYRLSPKYGWLFHVFFDINDINGTVSRMPNTNKLEMGMLVKNASLPKFSVDTKTYNAYNRPNIVQTKIHYDPLTISFHDDSADVIREFWYDYYSYYYRDSDYDEASYHVDTKYNDRLTQDWGYSIRQNSSAPYLRSIRIYSLHQKRFSEYILINPIIKSWRHGDHVNGENVFLQNEMTIEYESVLYSKGYVTANTVAGFADLHYDQSPSPLTPAGGGTNTILGPGGVLETVSEVVTDLNTRNLGSAAFKTFRAIENGNTSNLKDVALEELKTIGQDILSGNNPLSKLNIPILNSLFTGTSASSLGAQVSGIFTGLSAPAGSTDGATQASTLGVGTGLSGVFLPSSQELNQSMLSTFQSGAIVSNGEGLYTNNLSNRLFSQQPQLPLLSETSTTSDFQQPDQSYVDGLTTINDQTDVNLVTNQGDIFE